MFITDAQLPHWEAMLGSTDAQDRLSALTSLAWHVRERDSARSLLLVSEAKNLLEHTLMDASDKLNLSARLQLTTAEVKWLYSELETAHNLARAALADFQAIKNFAGCADVHWLLAAIALDNDSFSNPDAELELAIADARFGSEQLRMEVPQALSAFRLSHRSPLAAKERWGNTFPIETKKLHPGLATWVDSFWASFFMQTGDFGKAAVCCIQAYENAMASGQLRRAIHSAANAGECLSNLSDHDAAFEWMHRGLDLARSKTWPVCVGTSLSRLGEMLRMLGQLDAAKKLLYESIDALRPCKSSRSYLNALHSLGYLENDCKRHDIALQFFKQLTDLADADEQAEFQISARTGHAFALAQLGQKQEALVLAGTALTLARQKNDPYEEINALKVLAELNLRNEAFSNAGEDAINNSLYFLKQEIEVASNIEGYLIEGGLYEAVAREYAKLGDYQKAYEYTLKACAAHAQTNKKEIANRTVVMQIRNQTERAYEEAKYFKSLAAVEAERAATLQKNSQILERLSAIGQEITAHIDESAVFNALDRHVHAMLDAQAMGIWLIDGNALRLQFGVEDGEWIEREEIPLDYTFSNAVRCVKELREIHVQHIEGAFDPTHVTGTLKMLSCLFAPLAVGNTVLGVLSIQSTRENAYGELELLIFRTLLAYGSVALANAANAKKLAEAHIELERQKMTTVLVHAGKMMAVGKLASGVVHEMSHPVGSILMLTEAVQTLRGMDRIEEALDVTLKIGREVNRLRSLIKRLRRFARLDPPEVEAIGLQTVIDDARQLFGHQLEMGGVKYREFIPPVTVLVDSERLSLAIANIVCNACDAMAENEQRQVTVNAHIDSNKLRLSIRDTGPGLPPDVLNRVFEPFFTTKPDGLGLGMAISVESIASMNGSIEVANHPDGGAEFTLIVPIGQAHHQPLPASPIEIC
jgi:signal transduction histidine kinase